MTPDLQARIEKLAREAIADETICSCQSCQISAVHAVKNALTTLAEQIISEKDAEAAGLREALEEICDESTCNCEDYWTKRDRHDPSCPCGINMTAHAALAAFTAGRDLLAERDSLRERVRELEGRIERYENSG